MGEGSTTELELLSREAFAILQDTNSKKDSSVSGLKTKGKIKFEQHSTQSGAFQSEYVNYSTKPK
jgi:hypothetical protein